jgi:hypothetical protein
MNLETSLTCSQIPAAMRYPEPDSPVHTPTSYLSELHINIILDQGWANYGPRAKYGPLRGSMRPAEGLENAKKNEVSKNI